MKRIGLLKNKDVISWIFGHTKFFEPENPVVSYGNKYIQVDTGEVYKSGKW